MKMKECCSLKVEKKNNILFFFLSRIEWKCCTTKQAKSTDKRKLKQFYCQTETETEFDISIAQKNQKKSSWKTCQTLHETNQTSLKNSPKIIKEKKFLKMNHKQKEKQNCSKFKTMQWRCKSKHKKKRKLLTKLKVKLIPKLSWDLRSEYVWNSIWNSIQNQQQKKKRKLTKKRVTAWAWVWVLYFCVFVVLWCFCNSLFLFFFLWFFVVLWCFCFVFVVLWFFVVLWLLFWFVLCSFFFWFFLFCFCWCFFCCFYCLGCLLFRQFFVVLSVKKQNKGCKKANKKRQNKQKKNKIKQNKQIIKQSKKANLTEILFFVFFGQVLLPKVTENTRLRQGAHFFVCVFVFVFVEWQRKRAKKKESKRQKHTKKERPRFEHKKKPKHRVQKNEGFGKQAPPCQNWNKTGFFLFWSIKTADQENSNKCEDVLCQNKSKCFLCPTTNARKIHSFLFSLMIGW